MVKCNRGLQNKISTHRKKNKNKKQKKKKKKKNNLGHTETGPQFKVTSERLEKPLIELTTPGLQGKWLVRSRYEYPQVII